MEKDEFRSAFAAASQKAHQVACQLVSTPFPEPFVYIVKLNASFDGNPRTGDEVVYPEDSGKTIAAGSTQEVADLLWRDGKIPQWVDISIISADQNSTTFEVLCCGRYTGDYDRLYHHRGGNPPFHPLSPAVPPEWQSVEEHGKFPLDWFSRWHRSPEYWFFKAVLGLSKLFDERIQRRMNDYAWQRIMRIPLKFCTRNTDL